MKVLVYQSVEFETGTRLLKAVREAISSESVEICPSVADLPRRLHGPRKGLRVAVFYCATLEELDEISAMGMFLSDVRTILVLPDLDRPTLAKAHRMHPRLICGADSDFKEITAVLTRIAGANGTHFS